MTSFPIPVRMTGPGSQPDDGDELQYLAMPREMNTFRMPLVPDEAEPSALEASRNALATFLRQLARWDPEADASGPTLDLAGLAADALTITNQMLGEGEVAIQISAPRTVRIQESVFTGLWRVCEFDADGRLAADLLEAGRIPRLAVACAHHATGAELGCVEIPPGAMNSPALLREIGAQMAKWRRGTPAHVINLTLFPMTPDDHQVLEQALPVGPVAIMARGFGNCRITSTGARDVWRVQYFNQMNTLILNTIEVVAVPEVALAATEDLEDTRERLAELVAWMSESCTA
jgi:hydrogenase-1 operon protein HyaF